MASLCLVPVPASHRPLDAPVVATVDVGEDPVLISKRSELGLGRGLAGLEPGGGHLAGHTGSGTCTDQISEAPPSRVRKPVTLMRCCQLPCKFFRTGVSLCTALAILILNSSSARLYLPAAGAVKLCNYEKFDFETRLESALQHSAAVSSPAFNNRTSRGKDSSKMFLTISSAVQTLFITPQTLQNIFQWHKSKITKPSIFQMECWSCSVLWAPSCSLLGTTGREDEGSQLYKAGSDCTHLSVWDSNISPGSATYQISQEAFYPLRPDWQLGDISEINRKMTATDTGPDISTKYQKLATEYAKLR